MERQMNDVKIDDFILINAPSEPATNNDAAPSDQTSSWLSTAQRAAAAVGGVVQAACVPDTPGIAAAQGGATALTGFAVTNLAPAIMAEATIYGAGQTAITWGLPATVGRVAAVAGMAAFGIPPMPPPVYYALTAAGGLVATAALNAAHRGYQAYTATPQTV